MDGRWRRRGSTGTALREAETEAVIETLVALPGVGRWTAEIYAKFALGHADVFAAGDLALQESARRLFGLPRVPPSGVARDGRGLVAGACGCCAGAVGLLPLGH
jgi:3-methyladenine DNA glycosylase/8-oxoguanine DNA glycosylase